MDLNSFRPYFSRALAAVFASLVVYLANKGINLDAESQKNLLQFIDMAIWGVAYSLTHRSADKKINPGDAASSHLAEREHEEVKAMKSAEVENAAPVGLPSPELRPNTQGFDPDIDRTGEL